MNDNSKEDTIISQDGSQATLQGSAETLEYTESMPSSDESTKPGIDAIWGKLLPYSADFNSLDLVNNAYTFGREATCDYVFGKKKTVICFSKRHFKLTRYTDSDGYVEIEDLSRNGTYVNGDKIGTGKKQVLKSNDEIALSSPKLKAFIYVALNEQDDIDKALLERYTVCKELGRGTYGTVRLGFERGTCKKVAIKIISKMHFGLTNANQNKMMNEVNLLKSVDHPCIIKIEEVIDTEDTLYIVFNLIEGGDLCDRIQNQGQIKERTSKIILYQLLKAIKYLHSKGICHRDLKPENILLCSDDEEVLIKVTDFGVSKYVDANTMLKTYCGTPNYLAPEMVRAQGEMRYTNSVDCWSIGIVLYCCLVGFHPFSDEIDRNKSLDSQICSGECKFPHKYWKGISKEAQDLIKGLLKVDPEERLTLDGALNHKWFQDGVMLSKVNQLIEGENGARKSAPSLKRNHDEMIDEGDDCSGQSRQKTE